jgi:hypothetical protein
MAAAQLGKPNKNSWMAQFVLASLCSFVSE